MRIGFRRSKALASKIGLRRSRALVSQIGLRRSKALASKVGLRRFRALASKVDKASEDRISKIQGFSVEDRRALVSKTGLRRSRALASKVGLRRFRALALKVDKASESRTCLPLLTFTNACAHGSATIDIVKVITDWMCNKPCRSNQMRLRPPGSARKGPCEYCFGDAQAPPWAGADVHFVVSNSSAGKL